MIGYFTIILAGITLSMLTFWCKSNDMNLYTIFIFSVYSVIIQLLFWYSYINISNYMLCWALGTVSTAVGVYIIDLIYLQNMNFKIETLIAIILIVIALYLLKQ